MANHLPDDEGGDRLEVPRASGVEAPHRGPEGRFDLRYIEERFRASLISNEDVDLGEFIAGYSELYKFCELMGKLWGFVGMEINRHVRALTELRTSDPLGYSTLRRMVKHEMAQSSPSFPGSKAVLLLNRGLDFTRVFLDRAVNLPSGERMSKMGQDVYSETLAKFHNVLIRRAAHLAMYVLPSRDALLARVSGGDPGAISEVLPRMLQVTDEVYKRSQGFLESNGLLTLV